METETEKDRELYARMVDEAAVDLLLSFDCANHISWDFLRTEAERIGESILLADEKACQLVLRVSEDAIAQSFRGVRHSNMDPRTWAGRALSLDTLDRVRDLLFWNLGDAAIRLHERIAEVQDEILREGFATDTPWPILYDWHTEQGDDRKAELCRQRAKPITRHSS